MGTTTTQINKFISFRVKDGGIWKQTLIAKNY